MNSKSSLKQPLGAVIANRILVAALFACSGALQPSSSWAAQTVTVNPVDNLQSFVNQYPPGTTFSIAPGIHRLQSVVPKDYDEFVGQSGAILSGAALLTRFSQSGSRWISQVRVTQSASYRGECGF